MNLKKRVYACLLAISMLLFNFPMQALAQPVDATTQTSNFDVADSVNIDADSAGSGADSTSGDADSTSGDADSTSGDADSTGSDADSTISDANSTSSGADSTGGDTDPAGSGADSTSGDADSTSSGADSTGGDTDPAGSGADSTSGDADSTSSGADSTGGDTDPAGSGADSTSRDADVNSTDTTTDTSNYAVFSANGRTTPPSKIPIEGEYYYQLENKEDLEWFAGLVNGTLEGVPQDLDANAILTANITLNDNVLNADGTLNANQKDDFTKWTPIGNPDNIYTGTFDGDNHSITGLYAYESWSDSDINHHLALIGYLGSGGTVKDLTVSGSITGEQYLAGICSYVVGATVENCTSKVAVTVTRGNSDSYEADVGGVCGHVENSTITRCTYDGILTTCIRSDRAGGICGYISGSTIEGCYNNGKVTYSGSGQSYYAKFVGGICGYAVQTSIKSCENTESALVETERGNVIGASTGNCGGICGYLGAGGSLSSCTNAGTIRNNNTNNNIAENTGGICGGTADSPDISITDCRNSGTVEGGTKTAGIVGYGSHITVRNCTNTGTVEGTSRVGGISGYPDRSSLYDCKNEGAVSGTDHIGGILGYAIEVSLVQNCQNSGAITGTSYVGGILGNAGGTLKNCQNNGSVIAEGAENSYAGGIAGYLGSISSAVEGCTNTATVKGQNRVGGIAGYLGMSSDVQGCTNTATATVEGQDRVGGIVGETGSSVEISNNENTGNVRGTNYVGGLAGYGSGVSLSECQNESQTVTGMGNYVGGLCGYYTGSRSFDISDSYNTAAVTGGGSYVGGICGYSEGYLSTIYNTGKVVGNSHVGGICGQQDAKNTRSTYVECFYNTGAVAGNNNVGGICGYGSGEGTGFFSGYTIGDVTGVSGVGVGGIIGDAEDDVFLNRCYYLNTSINSSVDSNVDRSGAYPSTADEFENGKVCYGMGSSSSPKFWVQNVDEGFGSDLDSYPVFKTFRDVDSDSHVVYKKADDVDDYINHVYEHDYEYAVSTTKTDKDTLVRTCKTAPNKEVCPAISSTAVISAENVEYDGKPHEATVTYSEKWPADEQDLEISYAQKNSDGSSTPLDKTPVEIGTYIASITKGDQTASVTYKIFKYYPINYVIESDSDNWTLPEEVKEIIREQCLKDAPVKIEHGEKTEYPTIDDQYTFKTGSGTWKFNGWSGEESSVTGPVTLTCHFKFTPNTYKVNFEYQSADDTQIPPELLKKLETSDTVTHGSDVRLPYSVGHKFDVSDGYWVVEGWSGDGKNVTGDIILTATLKYVKAYKVNYAVKVDDSSKTFENAYLDFVINLYKENYGREPNEEELKLFRDSIPTSLKDLNKSLYKACEFDDLDPYHSTGDEVTPYLPFDKITASDTDKDEYLAQLCGMLGISLQFDHWEVEGAENRIPVVIGEQSVTFTAVWKAVKAQSPDPGETPDNGSNNGSDSGSNTPAKTPAPAQNVSAAAAPAAQAAAAVIPQTGDDSQPLMWVVLAAGSLGLLAVLLAAKRRRTDK